MQLNILILSTFINGDSDKMLRRYVDLMRTLLLKAI